MKYLYYISIGRFNHTYLNRRFCLFSQFLFKIVFNKTNRYFRHLIFNIHELRVCTRIVETRYHILLKLYYFMQPTVFTKILILK